MHDPVTIERIDACIHVIRGREVILQSDLARLYRLPRARLLSLTRRFPGEFCFIVEAQDLPTGSEDYASGNRVVAFTEYGALAVAYAVQTAPAMAVGLQIVRRYLRRRELGANFVSRTATSSRAELAGVRS